MNCLLLLVSLAMAPAPALTVAIARPVAPSPVVAEALVRLRGELASVGLATVWLDDGAADREGRLARAPLGERAGAHPGGPLDAVVAFRGGDPPDGIEVWASDRAHGRSVSRRVDLRREGDLKPSTLAIRALELLRSCLLELDLALPTQPVAAAAAPEGPAPVIAAAAVPAPSDAPRPGRLTLVAGAVAYTSPGGLSAAVAPAVRVAWAFRGPWALEIGGAGWGTHPAVENATGRAELTQQFAVAGIRWMSDDDGPSGSTASSVVRPFVTLSAGALHTGVEGQPPSPASPEIGKTATQWSLLLQAAVGAQVPLGDRLFLAGSAEAQLAEPYLAIRFDDQQVATGGRPTLLLALGLGARL